MAKVQLLRRDETFVSYWCEKCHGTFLDFQSMLLKNKYYLNKHRRLCETQYLIRYKQSSNVKSTLHHWRCEQCKKETVTNKLSYPVVCGCKKVYVKKAKAG